MKGLVRFGIVTVATIVAFAAVEVALRVSLQASLAGLGMRLIDPTRELTLDDFWVHDAHWQPSGHKKIADALVPHLSEVLNVRSRAD